MRKVLGKDGVMLYDFENGEFVTIYPKQRIWEYDDSLETFGSPQPWNMGTFVLSEDGSKAFLMTSSQKIEAAVIEAFNDWAGSCEWIDPKPIRIKRPKGSTPRYKIQANPK